MEDDLVMQAVKAIPNGPIKEPCISLCIKSRCCSMLGRETHTKGHFYETGKNPNPQNFKVVCTRLEHIAARAELFKNAPEGSKKKSIENGQFLTRYENLFFIFRMGHWDECLFSPKYNDGKLKGMWEIAIPRPTAEEYKMLEDSKPKPEITDKIIPKFAPTVDVMCRGLIPMAGAKGYEWVDVTPLRDIGGEWVVCVGDGGSLWYCDAFLPLKTERDKTMEHALSELSLPYISEENKKAMLLQLWGMCMLSMPEKD